MNNSDLAYQKLLQNKVTKLQKEISDLEKRNKGINLTNDITTEKIERKKLEVLKLQEELKDYTEKVELGAVASTVVGALDSLVDNHNEKREELQETIAELQELRKKLTTTRAQRKIEKKIESKQKKLQKLQKSDNRISGIQRACMYPKYKKELKKRQLLSKQEAKIAVAEASYNDLVQMQEVLNPNGNIIDNIKNKYYEAKKQHYSRKKDRAASILTEMQKHSSPIIMRGAGAVVVSKKLKEKLSRGLQQEQMMLEVAQNNNQMEHMVAIAK